MGVTCRPVLPNLVCQDRARCPSSSPRLPGSAWFQDSVCDALASQAPFAALSRASAPHPSPDSKTHWSCVSLSLGVILFPVIPC